MVLCSDTQIHKGQTQLQQEVGGCNHGGCKMQGGVERISASQDRLGQSRWTQKERREERSLLQRRWEVGGGVHQENSKGRPGRTPYN